jgi:hypothetical protein
MNALQDYASSDEEPLLKKQRVEHFAVEGVENKIMLAPEVDVEDYATVEFVPGETTKEIAFNVAYKELMRPVQGPLNPFSRLSSSAKSVHTGFIIHSFSFNSICISYLTLSLSLLLLVLLL